MTALFSLVLLAGALAGQDAPARPVPIYTAQAPDPARLDEAHKLVALLSLPSIRKVTSDKIAFMLAEQVMQAVRSDPKFQAQGSKTTASVQRLIDRQKVLVEHDLSAAWPMILEAQANAYALGLTIEQMKATEAFMATGAGQSYLNATALLEYDPRATGPLGEVLSLGMKRAPEEVAKLKADLASAYEQDSKNGK